MNPYFAFQWHITEDCDQRCNHCYIFAGKSEKKIVSMKWEDIKVILMNIEDFCHVYGRTPYLYITGGDPILHPYFWQLIALLKQKQIIFTILGNPFHLSAEICQKLYNAGCEKYQMSIDGMRNTHDWFRKSGSFDQTLEKIAVIQSAGIAAVIMTTVSGKNIQEIPDIIRMVVEHQVDIFAFARYVPSGSQDSNDISPLEYRDLLEKCDRLFRTYEKDPSCKTCFNRKDHLWMLYDYEKGNWNIPTGTVSGIIYDGCNCGNCHLTILPDGQIYACRRVVHSGIGNALVDSLKELWAGKMEDYREYKSFRKCSRCELLAWCRGCPAVAKGYSGDFYAADPQCWKEVK